MAILPALAGLSEGFSKTFGTIQDENRKNQFENNRLIAESLKKRADEDPTLTPDEHDNLYRQYYKTLHPELKPKDIETLIGTHSYIRSQIAQNLPAMPQAPQNQPTGMNDIPDAGASQGLGAMPQPPMTMGQAKFNEANPRTLLAEQQKFNAQRTAERTSREDLANFNEGKIQEIQKRTDITDDQKDQLLQPYGVKAIRKGGTGAATFVKGTISSEGLKFRLNQEGKTDEANAVPPGKFWSVAMDPSKTHTVSYTPTVGNTFRGEDATGTKFISKFPTDWNGQPTEPNTLYYPILNRAGGEPIGIMPHSLIDTESVHKGFDKVAMKDGGEALVPVTTTTETKKTPAGVAPGAASVAPPIPSMGEAQKPTPGMPGQPTSTGKTATPSSALPQNPETHQALTGRTYGAPIVIPGAGKSLTPEQKQKNEQIAEQLNNTIGTIKDLQTPEELAVLGNLMSTGKIRLQIDPKQGFWTSVLNEQVPLTEQEKNVAANWQLLAEGVLQMRIPMGGAGFRGPEGFGAIESNRGILGQNPDIIRKVLRGTLREFRAQRDPLAKNASTYGYEVKPEMEHGSAVTDTNSDLIKVQIPGQPPGYIHASQEKAFFDKYKNAKKVP